MRPLLRLTGWSALVAGLAHLLQFLVLGIGPALSEAEHPTPAEAAANYWFGLAGGLTFTIVGLCYLVFFAAATELVWRSAAVDAVVWRRAMQSAAIIGITSWFLAGMTNIARRGFNATAIAELAGDDGIARAALQSTYVGFSAAAITTAVVFCAWWIAFAVRGARTRTIGLPTAIAVTVLGGLVPLAGWVANLGGIPAIVLAFLVLGPVLLRRARRMEPSAPVIDASPVTE
ncbi:hypothetical protein [Microbacterium sp. No. 7]|uniref:hypothetical protein n=1 Tax=Microbacterium sp. No. 7 TaxID=1714373 RepID=UPI0006D0620D|nr:hypothetical protein [Microbacterium sp. No. 7]ALJ20167.1 hypothetical protein AOA12_09690 [Microbacterium sp. No. 7]